MVLCIVVGCGSKSCKHSVTFNCIAKVVTSQGEELEDLTRERRNQWIAAVSRVDVKSKNILDSERVCGLHFVSGKPAPTWDKHNIDWVPTLNLGEKEYRDQEQKKLQQIAAGGRAMRARKRLKRKIQQEEIEVTEKQKVLNVSGDRVANIEFSESYNNCTKDLLEKQSECNEEATTITTENQNDEIFCRDQNEEMATESQEQPIKRNAEVQTEEFDYMFCKETYTPPDQDYFRSDDKVRFYTGLPSFDVLMATFNYVAPHVSRKTQKLDQFQEFVLVLMKLRLNVPFQDLAFRFMVSLCTASRIFSAWMIVMEYRLKHLVFWPDRDQLYKTMPQCFKYVFGNKVTVIIDCFEVFIERPTNLLARAQTFSSYKHHNTIKILIGITPQGSISYISKAWGGRTSDKFLTENCGFLDKLLPGDLVMADRGFTITESVGLKQAKLVIPAFTKGKSQLDPMDVEKTRGIANVRIHVERVIGLLRRKYRILEGTLPTDFLMSNACLQPKYQVPMIDRVLNVCAALVNLCPPIVPFD